MCKITLICPCYKRPQRTLRAMECVANQDINGWEAFFIGDGCDDFNSAMESGAFEPYIEKAKANGNEIHVMNLELHHGGWGFAARNTAIKLARGEFIMFMDNDDVIKPSHFRNYLSGIDGTDYDLVYYNTWVEPINQMRNAALKFGSIGHHEIIVRAATLKQLPPQGSHYAHDWTLVENVMRAGKCVKVESEPTYIVKAIGGYENRERLGVEEID